MKKTICVLLGMAVVAGAFVAPADAKKKKKKPPVVEPVQADQTLYLRRDGEDCADPASLFLSLIDAEDIDAGSCGNQAFGVPGLVLTVNSLEYATREGDGIPITLDATKEITGLIGVKSVSQGTPARLGAGATTLHVELIGVTGGEEKTIASGDFDYTVTPGTIEQVYEVEIVLTPDTALDKAVFTSLKITLRNNGASVAHGFYTTDNPASNFTLGIWK